MRATSFAFTVIPVPAPTAKSLLAPVRSPPPVSPTPAVRFIEEVALEFQLVAEVIRESAKVPTQKGVNKWSVPAEVIVKARLVSELVENV